MDFQKFRLRYRQFGGISLVWQYVKLGLLPVVIKGFVKCIVRKQSFKTIFPEVLRKVEPYLIEKFPVSRFKFHEVNLSHEHPKIIWWC